MEDKYIINNINNLGTIIKTKRKSMNLTQKHLAALCNVGTRFISELENGKKTLEINKILIVINSLGLELYLKERALK